MNILELIIKGHPQVAVQSLDPATGQWQPHPEQARLVSKRKLPLAETADATSGVMRGLQLKAGERVLVKRAAAYWPVFAEGRGFFYASNNSAAEPVALARLRLGWISAGGEVVAAEAKPGAALTSVGVPAAPDREADLLIEVPRCKGNKVFLGVHKVLDRSVLLRQCVGTGVEIGPGPKPQVLPSAATSVKYVEQATPDQWEALYGKDSRTVLDKALWEHYVVGNADKVPAEPGSLDFIFSSHVVEHLANPLGHLAYWGTLLKPGGKVLAVIPDRDGSKDFVFPASTVAELVSELESGDMRVSERHYQRWLPHRMPRAQAGELMASGRSIHVHFYTPASMDAVLRATAGRLGFSRHEVTASPNHKDFFVTLVK